MLDVSKSSQVSPLLDAGCLGNGNSHREQRLRFAPSCRHFWKLRISKVLHSLRPCRHFFDLERVLGSASFKYAALTRIGGDKLVVKLADSGRHTLVNCNRVDYTALLL